MRYRAIATVTWDFEANTQEEAQELANKHLGNIPAQDGINDIRSVVQLDKIKEKIEKVKLGEFPIEEVMPYITRDEIKRDYECNGTKYSVKMNSHRYFIFRECMKCISCGLNGTRMILEYHPADKSPHFNLYGEEDGKLILMTKDHIHPRASGGEDRHSNYQTMCIICNNLKGHSNITLDGVRELRRLFRENKDKVTKKQLHLLMEDARSKLERPWSNSKISSQKKKILAKSKSTADTLVTTCDINLYENDDGFYGRSVYDTILLKHPHVGCIKKGVSLEPLLATKGQVLCVLNQVANPNETIVALIQQSLLKPKEI